MTGFLVIGAAPRTSRFPVPAFPSHAAGCRVFSRGIRQHAPYVQSFPAFFCSCFCSAVLLPASRYPPSPLRRIPRLFARFPEHVPHVPSFPGFLGRHCVGYRGFLRFPKARSARGVVGGYYRIMPLSFSDGAKRLHRQKGCAERARGRIRPWGKET